MQIYFLKISLLTVFLALWNINCVDNGNVQVKKIEALSIYDSIEIPVDLHQDQLYAVADLKPYEDALGKVLADLGLENEIILTNLRIENKEIAWSRMGPRHSPAIKHIKSIFLNATVSYNYTSNPLTLDITYLERYLVLPNITNDEKISLNTLKPKNKNLYIFPTTLSSSKNPLWRVKLSFREILGATFKGLARFKYAQSGSAIAFENRNFFVKKGQKYCDETINLTKNFINEHFRDLGPISNIKCQSYIEQNKYGGKKTYVDFSFAMSGKNFNYQKIESKGLDYFYLSLAKDLLLLQFDKLYAQ